MVATSRDGRVVGVVHQSGGTSVFDSSSGALTAVAGPAFAATPDQTSTGTTQRDLTGATVTFTVTDQAVWVHSWAALIANDTGTTNSSLWVTTDENNVEKTRNIGPSPVTSRGYAPNTWEYISTPGTYTRKVRFNAITGGNATVFTTAAGGAFIRTIYA